MTEIETYRNRLLAMRDRLRRQIDARAEEARDSISKPGETVHLHTHNADMDVEGLDEAVALSHATRQRIETVDALLRRLERDGTTLLGDARERERIDALLDNEEFAAHVHEVR